MLKKLIALVVFSLLLTTFVSYSFAQCNTGKQTKTEGSVCCQSCCGCACAK